MTKLGEYPLINKPWFVNPGLTSITSAKSMVLMTKRSLPSDSLSFFPHMCVQLGAKAQTSGLRQVFCCPACRKHLHYQRARSRSVSWSICSFSRLMTFSTSPFMICSWLSFCSNSWIKRVTVLDPWLYKKLRKNIETKAVLYINKQKKNPRGILWIILYREWPYHGIMDWLQWYIMGKSLDILGYVGTLPL